MRFAGGEPRRSGPCAIPYQMPAGKGRHLVPVSTQRHRAPAPFVGSRLVIEKEAAMRIAASSESGVFSLVENFRCRPCYSRQQPIEASLARHEPQLPRSRIENQLIVAFGYAKDSIDGLNPLALQPLLARQGAEDLAQTVAKAKRTNEQCIGGLRITLRQCQELRPSLRCDDS